MTDKLTDAEVKKALECCGEYSDCPHVCPLRDMAYVGDCIQVKAKAALDLINRLEEEKQNLEIELQAMRNATNGFKAEVKRLQNAYKQCAWERDTFQEELKTAKAEAYKEFAERLEEYREIVGYDRDLKCDIYGSHIHIDIDEFDNLLNELVGGTSAGKNK